MKFGISIDEDTDNVLIGYAAGIAAAAHHKQNRKYMDELYYIHCMDVAEILSEFNQPVEVICAGFLHDVLEDTEITEEYLREIILDDIVDLVLEVTDVSIGSGENRATRKAMDRDHVAQSSHGGANIKLADLISNTKTIAKYDRDFAKVYLAEKELLLEVLKHGNQALWDLAFKTLQEAQQHIIKESLH